MTSGSREDYLINILRLAEGKGVVKTTELSSFMNVAPASVTAMIKTLANEGLLNYERYKGITLSESGCRIARQIRRKHHIIEYFLIDYLGVDHDTAHEEAHKIEHAISDDSSIKLCNMVGNPIDSDCECCNAPCDNYLGRKGSLISLTEMNPDIQADISYIRSDDHDAVVKLMTMGFVPGKKIRVEWSRDDGCLMVTLDGSTVLIDAKLASCVFVNLKK